MEDNILNMTIMTVLPEWERCRTANAAIEIEALSDLLTVLFVQSMVRVENRKPIEELFQIMDDVKYG